MPSVACSGESGRRPLGGRRVAFVREELHFGHAAEAGEEPRVTGGQVLEDARRHGEEVRRAAGHGARSLFSGLDLVVSPGDVIGLIGPNGAGKSTLLTLLAGLGEPEHGSISLVPATAAPAPAVVKEVLVTLAVLPS